MSRCVESISAKRCSKGSSSLRKPVDEVKYRAASYAELRRAKEAQALRRRKGRLRRSRKERGRDDENFGLQIGKSAPGFESDGALSPCFYND